MRPFSAPVTVPECWACRQVTAQLADRPFQLAVMVTAVSPLPGYRLVTMPVEDTGAALGSLLVQVTAASGTAGRMMALRVALPPEASSSWLWFRARM